MLTRNTATSDLEARSTTELLRELMDGVVTLVRQELALARTELAEGLASLLKGVVSVAIGGAVLYAGVLALLAAAVLGLAQVMAAWLAALLVGGGATIIGAVMIGVGKGSLNSEHLKPRRTVESLRQSKDVLTRQTS